MNSPALVAALIDCRLFGLEEREARIHDELQSRGVVICFASELVSRETGAP